jgi:hypothetical protein
MAKRKKRSKRAPAKESITVTVPKEWESFDKDVIQGIVEATLGGGPTFGIDEVIVQASGPRADIVQPPILWDKVCN